MPSKPATKTLVGKIDPAVLAYTVGEDPVLDRALVEADCLGSAAHATMLAAVPVSPRILTAAQRKRIVRALVAVIRRARAGRVRITCADQDVHLAVERILTRELGDLGRRIHTARSRNDQVAVDLRLYAKEQLLALSDELTALVDALLRLGRRFKATPMAGRTHLQPAMPSSVGLWASSHAESLLDDALLLERAYELNDRCPLGAAAGFGVPLAIDRALTARLLGFREPVHNVLYAVHARGKCEAVILGAAAQVMLSLGRLAEDLLLYTMPEFGYFRLPPELGTGSSIMPQKCNPDVLELVRARGARVLGDLAAVQTVLKGLPGGYNRDLQDTKAPFLGGLQTTRASVRIMTLTADRLIVDAAALRAGFGPSVFAADRALALVAQGMPFRDAYRHVKENLDELAAADPRDAIGRRSHLGAPGGLDWAYFRERTRCIKRFAVRERRRYYAAISKLLGVNYPALAGSSSTSGGKRGGPRDKRNRA
jgi:argininosuccinate lyase